MERWYVRDAISTVFEGRIVADYRWQGHTWHETEAAEMRLLIWQSRGQDGGGRVILLGAVCFAGPLLQVSLLVCTVGWWFPVPWQMKPGWS